MEAPISQRALEWDLGALGNDCDVVKSEFDLQCDLKCEFCVHLLLLALSKDAQVVLFHCVL